MAEPTPGQQDVSPVQGAPRSQAARTSRGVFGGGAWRLGRVAGIEVAVDHTWVLIFLLLTVSLGMRLGLAHEEWHRTTTWTAAALTSLLFFASILLHELGHSLVAQRLGVRVRSITLFVFGGLAHLESDPRRPRDEILIAVAGPLVSVALGLVFLGGSEALRGAAGLGEVSHAALAWLGRINLTVAIFNVAPGFPLDGGRVLRGILWGVTGSFERATATAAASGSFFAYGLIALGLFFALFAGQLLGGLWLVFIGWFLLSAARATVGQMMLERTLQDLRIGDAMAPVEEARLSGSERVADVVTGAVLQHGLRTFYVVDARGRLRGLVTLRELAKVPTDERDYRRIEEIMQDAERLAVVTPEEDGWQAFRRMAERNVNQLPVVADGHLLLGAITRERLIAVVQARLLLEPERA